MKTYDELLALAAEMKEVAKQNIFAPKTEFDMVNEVCSRPVNFKDVPLQVTLSLDDMEIAKVWHLSISAQDKGPVDPHIVQEFVRAFLTNPSSMELPRFEFAPNLRQFVRQALPGEV